MSREFIDTNILIYSIDSAHPEKREKSIATIERLARSGNGVISTQVLQEFYVASTRELRIEPLLAKRLVQDFQLFDVVQVTPPMIESAIDRSILSTLSFWDSLILIAATIGSCSTLLSEDLNDGQDVDGVKIHNPFGQ